MKRIFPRMLTIEDIANRRLVWAKHLLKENEKLEAEVERLRKREATFDAFIDSLDCHKEHEWMLIEQIDEIHERLHGGEESECMETCQVSVPCPHGKDCDHEGAGRPIFKVKHTAALTQSLDKALQEGEE